MNLTRTPSAKRNPKRMEFSEAVKQAGWFDLVHCSPEIASVVKGVPLETAKAFLKRAREITRTDELDATVADFQRCPLPEHKAPTTELYRYISNKPFRDEAEV